MTPNAIVLVLDRLSSGYLGPYGNTWLETPAWNRLAARSALFETAIIDSPELPAIYRSFWHGRHVLSQRPDSDTLVLPRQLAGSNVQSWLITDERIVAEQAAAQSFTQRVVLPPGEGQSSQVVEETQLARVFATLIEVFEQATPPFLIWVHAQAMQASWDAPYALRAALLEEEDPDPPIFTSPPDCRLTGDYDPDLLLGIQQAFGGQVAVLDTCLGILLDTLWSSPLADSTALMATATRGFPIGEHGYVGLRELPLYGELVQVPWINHWPSAAGATWRIHQMVQPPDMYPTLLDWFAAASPDAPLWGRSLLMDHVDEQGQRQPNLACSVCGRQRALRVPAWFLRQDDKTEKELFVKPDDRWEFNEVSQRCTSVVEELSQVLDQFEAAAAANDRRQLTALSEALLWGLA